MEMKVQPREVNPGPQDWHPDTILTCNCAIASTTEQTV